MGEQMSPTPLEPILESSRTFERGKIKARAGFRTYDQEVLVGGPVEVEFFVENTGTKPLYLLVGADRARLRPAFFSFLATLEDVDVPLNDPAAEALDLGGPATVITIETGQPYSQMLLINQFVTLEKISTALAPDKSGVLRIRCQRPLPLSVGEKQAFQVGRNTPMVDVLLIVGVHRDDAALEALVARLTALVRAVPNMVVSPNGERAISQLVALRSPIAVPYLQNLTEHPDPVVRMLVERALKAS